jgi:hypothetical protein
MRGTEGVPQICINLMEAYYIERAYMFPRTYTVGEACRYVRKVLELCFSSVLDSG